MSSLHICPICIDQIRRDHIIYYHKADRSSLSSKIAKVFHAFHEECYQEALRHGHVSCPVCKEYRPHYEYTLADDMYYDERLSEAWAEKNFENANRHIKTYQTVSQVEFRRKQIKNTLIV